MSLIDPTSLPHLGERYPCSPGRLRHHLAAEGLLGFDALATAARALPRKHVVRRVHNASNGEAFRVLDSGAHLANAIAAGGAGSGWIMLSHIQQLPAYRALIERLLGEIAPVIGSAAEAVRDINGFVFISAPGTHTPFHFDAEYSILFQIAGDKVLAAYPPAPPFLDLARREAYHRTGENLLEWKHDYAARGEQHLLARGDALFLPYAAPHWIHAGYKPSISLSVTWQCRKSRAIADALSLNPLLRRVGLPAYDPVARPSAPRLRAAASRIGQRIGLV
ncbi:transcription factor jumonji, JmjC [uncultured Erythrobacter sp.]|uniref:transcription factor jumonji, JmjC n=1 Tax=uncultured Erythrobacter sp. TaxID=263913 RepID=UPI002657FCAA|nr:transcription factor jumonji, JmjC [uncultured Erythrobacter sp.]